MKKNTIKSKSIAELSKTVDISNTIILHHTEGSPYAQKIRLLLGYTGSEWLSVIASSSTPNRELQKTLVGGYSRRIPIMQIGGDVFCDTGVIMREIARLSGKQSLEVTPEIESFLDRVEVNSDVYQAMIGSISTGKMIKGYFKHMPFKELITFLKGRKQALGNNMSILKKYTLEEAKEKVEAYYQELENQLGSKRFLFSDKEPTLADFSAFQMIWYHERLGTLVFSQKLKQIQKWYNTMKQIGTGKRIDLIPEDAIAIARKNVPREIPKSIQQSDSIGKEVSLVPNDILGVVTMPVKGVLVGEDEYKYIIRRETEQTGVIHVHFPKNALGACL